MLGDLGPIGMVAGMARAIFPKNAAVFDQKEPGFQPYVSYRSADREAFTRGSKAGAQRFQPEQLGQGKAAQAERLKELVFGVGDGAGLRVEASEERRPFRHGRGMHVKNRGILRIAFSGFAQRRYALAAERSPKVTQKDEQRRSIAERLAQALSVEVMSLDPQIPGSQGDRWGFRFHKKNRPSGG